MPRRPGLLGNMANPLLYGGLGLLSQGPSLTPQGPMGGLMQGLALGNQANQQQAGNAMRQQQMEMQRRQFEAKQAAAKAAASAPVWKNVPGVGLVNTNAAGGPSVAPGMEAAPATPSLKQVVGPDGKPMWTTAEDALGQQAPVGGPLVSNIIGGAPGEKEAAILRAKSEEQQRLAQIKIDEAQANYDAVLNAQREKPSLDSPYLVEQAAKQLALARQSKFNEGRELSNAAQRALEPRGFIQQMAVDAANKFMDGGQTTPLPQQSAPAPVPIGTTGPVQRNESEAVRPPNMPIDDWNELQMLRRSQGG